MKRPIVNTRDEPHADPQRYRRLHVIVGDANLCEVATFLKVGTTAIVLAMIEDDFIDKDLVIIGRCRRCAWSRTTPPATRRSSCRRCRLTAVELQWEFLRLAQKYADESGSRPAVATTSAARCSTLGAVFAELERDPLALDGQLDWVTKLGVARAYVDRDGLEWNDPKLSLLDLQYHDVRPDRSLYERLVRAGKVERLVDEADVIDAMTEPPARPGPISGAVPGPWPDAVVAANWDSLILDVGSDPLRRIPMMEPLRGTKAHVAALFEPERRPRRTGRPAQE